MENLSREATAYIRSSGKCGEKAKRKTSPFRDDTRNQQEVIECPAE